MMVLLVLILFISLTHLAIIFTKKKKIFLFDYLIIVEIDKIAAYK